jgi:phosphate transport system protein
MRHSFDEQLNHLQQAIMLMGQKVSAMIELAVLALARTDGDLARQVIAADDEIDQMQIDLEVLALQLLALQQPMARDLRAVATGLKLVTDLERMGDHATDIAEITVRLAGEQLIKPLVDIPHMATLAQEMTRDALTAYVSGNEALARRMIEQDHEVDHLYKAIFDELLAMMQQDPAVVKQATLLLHVAMYLERIGDHATNLGEWTIYRLTGELQELNN